MERKIKEMFGLQVVKILKYTKDYAYLKEILGKEAAILLEEEVGKRNFPRLGIGGGNTLYKMIEHLSFKPRKIRIYPMAMIGRGLEIEYVDSIYLVTSIFYKSLPEAKAFTIGIPPLPKKSDIAISFKQFLLNEIPETKLVYKGAKNVDIAFIGAGAVIPTGSFTDELSKLGITIQNLKAKGVIGGINYNWCDGDGNQIGEYFITVSIEDLRALSNDENKLVVLVAGGEHKFDIIRVSLSTKIVNAIITDDLNAQRLMSYYGAKVSKNIHLDKTSRLSSPVNYTLLPLEKIPLSVSGVMVSPNDSIRLKITNRCPFSCRFCHKEGGSISQDLILSEELILALKRMMSELYIREVHLTGGEPTSHPLCSVLVSKLCDIGLKVKMTTNGQFEPKLIENLVCSGLKSINFSIHAMKPVNLSAIQEPPRSTEWGREALKRQLINIKVAKEFGLEVKVNTVVQENIQNVIDIISFCKSEELSLRLLNDLTLGSLSISKIKDILQYLDSEIEGIRMFDGSSSYSFQVITGSDFRFSVKAIRKCSLRSMCSYCDIRDQCEEWFYGIRVEQINNLPMIRLCLHREDFPAIQKINEFFESEQFSEIKQLMVANIS